MRGRAASMGTVLRTAPGGALRRIFTRSVIRMFFEDFTVGQEFPLNPVIVDKEEMLSFARRYDPIRMHLDEAYAASTVFGGLIAPGVLSFMIVWAEFARLNVWGDELVAGKNTKIEWHAPVYAGDLLTGKAVVTRCEDRNRASGLVDVLIDAVNQHRVLVLSDTTELVIRKRPHPRHLSGA